MRKTATAKAAAISGPLAAISLAGPLASPAIQAESRLLTADGLPFELYARLAGAR